MPDLGAGADLARLVDIGRSRGSARPDRAGAGSAGPRSPAPALGALPSSTALRARQHPQHAQPFAAIGARPRARSRRNRGNAGIRCRSGSACVERDGHRARAFAGTGIPSRATRCGADRAGACRSHGSPSSNTAIASVADDDQLLLLERVQPGHEDMRLLAAGKRQVRRRHVGDRLVQEIAADGLDLARLVRRRATGSSRGRAARSVHRMSSSRRIFPRLRRFE